MSSPYPGMPLSPEQIEERKAYDRALAAGTKVNTGKVFLRLQPQYIPFFQAMAEDYYQRGKIDSPSIGLLAKTCLITAGNAWNRMMIQIMNKEYERQQAEKLRLQQEQPHLNIQSQTQTQPPKYQRRIQPNINARTQEQLEDELIEQTLMKPQQEGQRLASSTAPGQHNNRQPWRPTPFVSAAAAAAAANEDEYEEEY